MLKERKNQVVLGLLVAMVSAAGYLNYLDSSVGDEFTLQDGILLSEEGEIISSIDDSVLSPNFATDVIATDGIDVANLDETGVVDLGDTDIVDGEGTSVGEAVFVSNNIADPFFVEAKLEREQSRAKQKDYLVEVINNESVDEDEKKLASDKIISIQERIEKETACEAMIEAKGFKDVYVRIDDNTVDVIVSKEQLSETELAQIEDIVTRKTGYTVENIRISTFKASN